MTDEPTTETALHECWQQFVSYMVQKGVSEIDAIETMLTVALANMLRLDGAERTVTSLDFIARNLITRQTAH